MSCSDACWHYNNKDTYGHPNHLPPFDMRYQQVNFPVRKVLAQLKPVQPLHKCREQRYAQVYQPVHVDRHSSVSSGHTQGSGVRKKSATTSPSGKSLKHSKTDAEFSNFFDCVGCWGLR
ncbi:unnamed protein product [Calicophoron daubneyi]|uniref:Uncharacterized protein n=1 Tax=Calicophoron daubneyi TaxID=300641 RepID=A0AAV2TI95_CALDB